MPRRTTAAKRYAEAIAGLARDEAKPEAWQRWRDDLTKVATALEDPVLRLTAESPRISPAQKQQLLRERLGDSVAPQTYNLISLMARRGRLELLPDVLTWFGEQADRALNIRHFTVTTATPLTEQQRAQLRQRLGGAAGSQVMLDERVDANILGGLVLREEDVIRDFSVRAKLENLRERMN